MYKNFKPFRNALQRISLWEEKVAEGIMKRTGKDEDPDMKQGKWLHGF
jgi:hypothetical protein